ncbi:MAG: 4-hydroxythreonine-4-phosphate dehydrogenase PdxA [Gammaproteobacteria bacterium]|nr:4-hydroxythreonine-4-phosphate dehydrogenase PdxA [Gammaproteobacteria bacterium]
MNKIAVSSGDPAGIGPDICIKAFGQKKVYDFFPVIFGDKEIFVSRAKQLGIKVDIQKYNGEGKENLSKNCLWIDDHFCNSEVKTGVADSSHANYIVSTFKECALRTLASEFEAIVTCPINKEIINKGGISFTGHTEELAKLSKTEKVVMMLASKDLKVALASTHIPLKQVAERITFSHLEDILLIINRELKEKWLIQDPHIKVLGLNPHAGDGGYIGKEEEEVIIPVIEKLKKLNLNISGPHSADTAFISNDKGPNVDAILAMYHDQGLPVIKSLGFGEIVNITLGLPFIRTSVDHGTAYDMAGNIDVNDKSLITAANIASQISDY